MQTFKWQGCRFYANLPEVEFSSFRETGYAKDILLELNRDTDLFENYDVFVLFRLAAECSEWVLPSFSKPLILFVISHERGDIPDAVINGARYIFKQYLRPELEGMNGKLYRIPVGPSHCFPLQLPKPFAHRGLNVFFSGNLHRGRAVLYKELTGAYMLPFPVLHRMRRFLGTEFSTLFHSAYISFSDGFHKGMVPHAYAQLLADAKIVLCPYGLDDRETMRHFEAMQQGCVVVTDKMPDTFYFSGAPFVVLPGWKHLKQELITLLKDPERLEDLHRKTTKWWQDTCSVEAVVQYIQRQVKSCPDSIEPGFHNPHSHADIDHN